MHLIFSGNHCNTLWCRHDFLYTSVIHNRGAEKRHLINNLGVAMSCFVYHRDRKMCVQIYAQATTTNHRRTVLEPWANEIWPTSINDKAFTSVIFMPVLILGKSWKNSVHQNRSFVLENCGLLSDFLSNFFFIFILFRPAVVLSLLIPRSPANLICTFIFFFPLLHNEHINRVRKCLKFNNVSKS